MPDGRPDPMVSEDQAKAGTGPTVVTFPRFFAHRAASRKQAS